MTSEHEWELNRENIRPLRSGRNVRSINSTFGGTQLTLHDADLRFEKDFIKAECSDDPLEICTKFVSWFEDNFPTGKQLHLCAYLQRIISAFGYKVEYLNDERMLKMWVKLAENKADTSLDVLFERAYTAGCCRLLAKFYVRWAEWREDCQNVSGARKVLQMGRQNCAEPLDLLNEAADALEMRQLRLMSEVRDVVNDENTDYADSSRVAFGRLQGIGPNLVAPVIREPIKVPRGLGSVQKQHVALAQQTSSFFVYQDETADYFNAALAPQNFGSDIGHIKFAENSKDPVKWKEAVIDGVQKDSHLSRPAFKVFDENEYQQKRSEKLARAKNAKLTVANEIWSIEELCANKYNNSGIPDV